MSMHILKKSAFFVMAFLSLGFLMPYAKFINEKTIAYIGESYSSSMELDQEGNPVISYYDRNTGSLRLTVCESPDCEQSRNTAVDEWGGIWNSMVLNKQGHPVLAYLTPMDRQLKVVTCHDPFCNEKTFGQIDVNGYVGELSDIVLDSHDNPRFVIREDFASDPQLLELVVCDDPACESYHLATLENAYGTGVTPRLVLNSMGNPVITYFYSLDWYQAIITCDDPDCSSFTRTVLEDTSSLSNVSLVLDEEDRPLIAYQGLPNNKSILNLIVCENPSCTDYRLATIDDSGNTGWSHSMALDSRGFPFLSYADSNSRELMLATCTDRYCQTPSIATLRDNNIMNSGITLVMNEDGEHFITYHDLEVGTINLVTIAGNEPPQAVELTDSEIQENQPEGTVIGQFSCVDPDDEFCSYFFVPGNDEAEAFFSLDNNQLITNSSFDFEQQEAHEITIRAEDGFGGFKEETFMINVLDEVEATPSPVIAETPTPVQDDEDEIPPNRGGVILAGSGVILLSVFLVAYLRKKRSNS